MVASGTARRSAQGDAEQLSYLLAAGYRSAIIVPLSVRGRVLASITFVTAESGRMYGPGDLALAEDLARRAALAVDNARLYQLERRSNERLKLLADAGVTLSSSLDYDRTLENVADLSLPTLGDFGYLDVVEENTSVRRIARAYQDPEMLRELEQTRWVRSERSDVNVCALSSGRPAYHPNVNDEWFRDVAVDPDHLALMRRLAFRSMISVPLVIQGRTLGALTLFFGKSGRSHTPPDVELAGELARRAAIAIEHVRLFASAQAAKRHAEEASRMKDEFLGIVSHELRTPLTAILGWARILETKASDPVLLERGLEVIRRNANAQVRIIEDILDVSRIITGKLRLEFKPIELDAVLRTAIDVLRPTAEAKGLRIDFVAPDPCPRVLGDPDRLQQVAWNLLSNSLKFTPQGGCIQVKLSGGERQMTVNVVDSGAGIAPDFLPYVFDRFRQGDASATRAHGGLGLGLAIVRHLVELHGGTVQATSLGLGRGATFTITLPALPTASTRPGGTVASVMPPVEDAGKPIPLDGLRVLVVDDEPDARELLVLILRAHGAITESAGSAHEALECIARSKPDVLVSDIAMPGADGIELIQKIRQLDGDVGRLPAIALTAYSRSESRRKILAAGFQVHVAKPIEPAALTAVVANLAGKGAAAP
jgi:signal transduction histidine kinase